MRHWLRLHRLALGSTLRLFAANPLASSLNLLVVGIAVALPLGLYTLVTNLQTLAGRLPSDPQASVFLKTDANGADEGRVETLLKQNDIVASYHRIGRDEALHELEKSSGMGGLVAGLPNNPLPDTFSLMLRDGSPDALDKLANQLKADPAVDEVQMDADWARRLAAIVSLGRETTTTVAAVLGAGLLLITANMIRLQILTRRDEIEVSKLIGATDSFIRRPFLYFAIMQGILGSLVGLGVVAIALSRLSGPVGKLAMLYGEQFSLSLPDATAGAATLAVVLLLSLIGATLSVRRHLRVLDA
ncbi:MAG: ABC transporter permease [Burkholderiales bacterium]|nr:ABC transporter permease [Burkholderiales bacterium]